MRGPLIARLSQVSVARAGNKVLQSLNLEVHGGDRIYVRGENGAGKSTLLALLAGRLHPWQNAGERDFPWLAAHESLFHLRRHVTLVGRDEQLRLQKLYAQQTVADLLLGHCDGDDFLYRDATSRDHERVDGLVARWQLDSLAERRLKTLSLGEMRLVTIARADMFARRLYLLDEVLNSLSEDIAAHVIDWMYNLSPAAAVLFTGHGAAPRLQQLATRNWQVSAGSVTEQETAASPGGYSSEIFSAPESREGSAVIVHSDNADFYHDFKQIFQGLTFELKAGDRILLTGPNGSGKTTLLRILHGDFRPAWQRGHLNFLHSLEHHTRHDLWQKVQFVAAAHFDYFLPEMTVQNVFASRISGSLYRYADSLPDATHAVIAAFDLNNFLGRPFTRLSEGEKTRVLLARAFLEPAPVYLIDEGFMALSERYFAAALRYLNSLPAEAAIVIAANERIGELHAGLSFRLSEWQLDRGRLTTHL